MKAGLGLKKTLSVLAVCMFAAAFAGAQDEPASNMEILRDKIKADKKLLIAENLGLTEAESKTSGPSTRTIRRSSRPSTNAWRR